MGEDIDGEATWDLSGNSVAMNADGTIVAIGAVYNDADADHFWKVYDNRGHVRVYQYNNDTREWEKIGQDIDGEATGDQSGHSVAMNADGTIVAIGARFNKGTDNNDNIGHVRVYQYNNDTREWEKIGDDIDGEAAGDESGWSVAMNADGTIVAIGARFNVGTDDNDPNTHNFGHVRVYQNEQLITSTSSGDPYVTTLCGNKFKLPNSNKIYRMLQFTDSDGKDLIVNASVSQLSTSEIKKLELTASFFGLNPVTNGYFYEKFYISYGNKYVVFDRNINLIDTNISYQKIDDIKISITYENEIKQFKCPIQGNSTSKDTVIKIGNNIITLKNINHSQIINGIEFTTHKRNTNHISGILNTYYHPKNYTIKKLNSTKISNSNINKKMYKKNVKEMWVCV